MANVWVAVLREFGTDMEAIVVVGETKEVAIAAMVEAFNEGMDEEDQITAEILWDEADNRWYFDAYELPVVAAK